MSRYHDDEDHYDAEDLDFQGYAEGDVVIVSGGFGTERPLEVAIEGLGEKGGRPLFDYTDHKGQNRWAYLYQISRKVSSAKVAA